MHNILIICTSSEVGGGTEHVWRLLTGLDKNRFRVVLAVPNNGPYFSKFKNIKSIEVVDLPVRSVNPKVLYDLWNLGRKYKVELIHSHGKGAGIYSRPVGLLLGKPVIHTLHGIHYQAYRPIYRRVYLTLEKILGFSTTKFVNVSNGEKDLAVELGLYSPDKAVVIYNGVVVPEAKNPQTLRQKLGLSGTVLINVARFNVQKGHEYLLSALPKIAASTPNVKLVMLGDGERLNEIKQLAKKLEVEKYCNFAGFQSNVIEYLQAGDVCISSSLWEGLPISLLEAMSVRLPVVATDVVGNNEIVEDQKTGLLAEPRNSEDLAKKVILMLSDKNLKDRLSNSGYERIKERFSLEQMIRKTESLYQEVLNKNIN